MGDRDTPDGQCTKMTARHCCFGNRQKICPWIPTYRCSITEATCDTLLSLASFVRDLHSFLSCSSRMCVTFYIWRTYEEVAAQAFLTRGLIASPIMMAWHASHRQRHIANVGNSRGQEEDAKVAPATLTKQKALKINANKFERKKDTLI